MKVPRRYDPLSLKTKNHAGALASSEISQRRARISTRFLTYANEYDVEGLVANTTAQSTPAVISARARVKASTSSAVLNGPGLRRRVPSGNVPSRRWA